jgi:SAM-dependent methyltransferase
MTDVWSERASAYVASDAHAAGEDLDVLVEWALESRRPGIVPSALDVATGGGHVARRLREVGFQVVTCDPAHGMRPDVVCAAESLPFAARSFDVVACRTAAHHFADVRAAVREMARVAADRVIVVDTLHMGDDVEEAERLRDPSHVRNHTDAEWREIVLDAGLGLDDVRFLEHAMDLQAWLDRTGCAGDEAARVVELLGDRVAGGRLTLSRIAICARTAGA